MSTFEKLQDQSGRDVVREAVRPMLISEFEEWSINPDAVYLNSLDSLESRIVIASSSLTELTVQLILDKEELDFIVDWEGRGLFTQPWSFADEHRVAQAPSMKRAANIMTTVALYFR